MKYCVSLICSIVIFASCQYRTLNRSHQITAFDQLKTHEPMVLKDVSICSTYRTGWGLDEETRLLQLNNDSILEYFLTALESSNLKTRKSDVSFKPCFIIIPEDKGKYYLKSTERRKVSTLWEDYDKGLYMIPIIGLIKWDRQEIFEISNSLSIQIFIIHDGELIYSRAKGFESMIDGVDASLTNITQENWNELVERLFEDYMEAVGSS